MKTGTSAGNLSKQQLSSDLKRRPDRPAVGSDRRTTVSVSVDPKLINAFDRWAYENDLSRSRGFEVAIDVLMKGKPSGTDI